MNIVLCLACAISGVLELLVHTWFFCYYQSNKKLPIGGKSEAASTTVAEGQEVEMADKKVDKTPEAAAVEVPADTSKLRLYNERELRLHNEARKAHGCPPCTLDEGLMKRAQAYAQKLVDTKSFEHDDDTKDGENLAMSGG